MKARLFGLAVLAAAATLAQTPTAMMVGRVVDSSGAAMPGVRITVTNVNTGAVRHATTAESADFSVPNLAPGTYNVMAETEGFRAVRREGLELQVDQVARIELTMQVAAVSETIEVTAAAPPILNTENATRGEVITNQEINEMPLDGRDFEELAFYVPGVSRQAPGGSGSNLSINGARTDNTNYNLDGFSNREVRKGKAQVRPPIDSVQEFKVQVSGYSAEYGRFAGGVVNMVLKGGTNRLHGIASEYLRNDLFDARNFFDAGKSKLRRSQFGGSLDGPVYIPKVYDGRDRTFFLASWESYRRIQGTNSYGRVLEQNERAGDFNGSFNAAGKPAVVNDPLTGKPFPGNRIPLTRIHPMSMRIMELIPLPNLPGQANNYHANINDTDANDSFLLKLDHRFSEAHNLSFRYTRSGNDSMGPFSGGQWGRWPRTTDRDHTMAGLTYTAMLRPTLINEARFGVTRSVNHENATDVGPDYVDQLGFSGGTDDPIARGMPRVTVTGLFNIGPGPDNPDDFWDTTYQWGDTMTWVKGRHIVKFGGDMTRNQLAQPFITAARGTLGFKDKWTSVPVGDFLLGMLNSSKRLVGTNWNNLRAPYGSLFFQDDFKISPTFTLNAGVRYEIQMPVYDKYDHWSNFIPELGQLVIASDRGVGNLRELLAQAGLTGRVMTAADAGLPRSLSYMSYKKFSPRVGFAWRPFGGTGTVVRGGYGIFHSFFMVEEVRSDLGNTFPFSITQTYSRVSKDPNALTLSNPFPAAIGKFDGVTSVAGIETHPKSQYVQSWNLTVEREVLPSVGLELGYSGSKGTHLARQYDYNQPFRVPELRLPGGSFPRPIAEFSTIDYYAFGSNSIYNAGMLSLRKRFSRGTFFRVNYTYGKSIDDASRMAGGSTGGFKGAQDSRNLRLERARSDWDVGHTLTSNFVTELPVFRRNRYLGGWQLAGTARFYTGLPLTPQLGNASLDAGDAPRPDRIAKGRLEERTADRWFDLAAFPIVPTGSYRMGNSARNPLDGPGAVNVNMSFMKKFRVRERDYFQFRWEVFNAINRTNFDLPEVEVDTITGGVISSASPARTMQFALKYVF